LSKTFGVKDRSLVYVFTLNEQGEMVVRTSGAVELGKMMTLNNKSLKHFIYTCF